jgi:hypothetical protein
MPSLSSGRWPALCCALVLSACGGGGGDSPAPAPAPPPPPPPADTTAPDTTLSATPGAVATSASGTFTVSSSETGSTFEASVDGGAYATVAATFTLSNLAQGAHSINVRARDATGNIDATPASFSWTIDSLAPDTTLATVTPVNAAVSSASFTFTSEAGATFEVAVDGGAFTAATSPLQLAALTDGAHGISVRARDTAGNLDATPSMFTWTVDTMIPDTTIVNSPAEISNAGSGSFTFSSNEPAAAFQVALDGAPFATAPNPYTFSGLSNGRHTFAVRAIDAAGNSDATPVPFAWTVDMQAPDTTITSAPPANSNSASATFVFLSEVDATYQVSVDGAAYVTAISPYQLTGIANGAHTLNVRAIDAAGNVDVTPASFSWQVDTSQPSARIVFPPAVSYTDASQLHVRGTASDAHVITGITVNGVAATSSDAFSTWSALVPIAAGDNNLVVSVTDSFGNTNANAAQVQVANRGVVLSGLSGIAWDAAHARVLTADGERDAIVALRASDGYATIFSDASHGTGPSGGFFVVAVDSTNNRAIALGGGEILYVDLTTGNRTVVPTDPFTPDTTFLAGITCNNPCTRLYSTAYAGPPNEVAVFSVDLITGVRTVISGGSFHLGSGPSLRSPTGLVLDTSQVAPRLLVTDTTMNAVMAVDVASGSRSVLSSALAPFTGGTGPAIDQPYGLTLDAANIRALVTNNVTGAPNQVVAVSLASGNRTVLPLTGTGSDYQVMAGVALDPINQRLFLSAYPRANVVQVDLATHQQTRFADSNVGTGPMIGVSSVLIDAYAPSPSLLASAFGGVVRIDLATGARNLIATTNFANGGPPFRPNYLQYDTRPGVPANRLFYTNTVSSSTMLYSLDVATGVSTTLSTTAAIPYTPHPELPLDGANGRLLINVEPTFGRSQVQQINVATGAAGPVLADSTIGAPTFGQLNAMALETVPGQPQRIIAMDGQSILYGINTANGSRTVVSSNAPVGSGPSLAYADSIAIDPATRRALLVSGSSNSILEVDLLTGNRTLVSGLNLDDQTLRGTGPRITPLWSRVAADFTSRIAFVTSGSDSILAVDLVSGDRVITAR